MLTLSRPHRQALATAGLLLLTVAPTAYVAHVAWKINRTGHARDVEVEIGRQLGLQVSLREVRHPRPGEDVLRGVVFRQEEPRGKAFAELARAEEVRILRRAGEIIVEAKGLHLRGDGPRQAMDQITALLARAGDGPRGHVSLSAPTCLVDLGDDGPGGIAYTLREVAATFGAEGGTPVLRASYRVVGDGPTTRCELTLTRDRSARPVAHDDRLRDQGGPCPCQARVLDPYFATADWLGASARVSGSLTLQKAGEGDWEAEFRGELLDVDLAALVSRWFPDHRLGGKATVRVRSARWADRPGGQGPGWVEADGSLAAGPGAMSVSLLEALKGELKFKLDPRRLGRRPGRRRRPRRRPLPGPRPGLRDGRRRPTHPGRRPRHRLPRRRRAGRWDAPDPAGQRPDGGGQRAGALERPLPRGSPAVSWWPRHASRSCCANSSPPPRRARSAPAWGTEASGAISWRMPVTGD